MPPPGDDDDVAPWSTPEQDVGVQLQNAPLPAAAPTPFGAFAAQPFDMRPFSGALPPLGVGVELDAALEASAPGDALAASAWATPAPAEALDASARLFGFESLQAAAAPAPVVAAPAEPTPPPADLEAAADAEMSEARRVGELPRAVAADAVEAPASQLSRRSSSSKQPVASQAQRGAVDQTMPRAAAPRDVTEGAAPESDESDDEMEGAPSSGVTARVVARRRGLVEEAPETPAAPTPDGPTHRARLLAAQGPAVFDPFTQTALGVHVGTSQAFEEAVAARSEKIRSLKSSQLVQHNFSEPEVRFVTGAWAPNIRNLAVAEILGDAAPSASSPRDPSPDELAAMLQRFQLRGGNVNALLADANVAPMET